MKRETVFSPCRKWRYTLWRDFETEFLFEGGNRMENGFAQFIGLNPSTADENQDDPTLRRCIQFAKDWGFGALCMTNAFAWRDTLPSNMKKARDPIGCDNTNQIRAIAEHAGIIIAAWGRDGDFGGRQAQVLDALRPWKAKLHHLGLNGDGTPKHPLYLRGDTKPTPWAEAAVSSL